MENVTLRFQAVFPASPESGPPCLISMTTIHD
jgi:hypothetical protein